MFMPKARTTPQKMPGYSDAVATLLHARGITTPEAARAFLHPDASMLHDPNLFFNMREAVALVAEAGRRHERVVIYGDYDVDGTCASAILKETLEKMGIRTMVYIPSRHDEGYGLNMEAISQLALVCDLLISVDCGITSVKEVAHAKSLGMKVIITDHHTLPDALPQADAVLSPLLGDYPSPMLCGAAVAWKFSMALMGRDFAMKQLDLAALATIADLVPLLDENRVIAALGLDVMTRSTRPGIVALKEVAGLKAGLPVTGEQVGFQLAPRLNASGRLTTAEDALRLLTASDLAEARMLAQTLNQLNERRKQEEQAVLQEAFAQIETMPLHRLSTLVIRGEGWNHGVIGLAAGRIAEKYACPTVVLTEHEGMCVGSGRAGGDTDLYQALKSCQTLFERFGGHKKAAGLTMRAANVEAFRQAFDEAVKHQLPEEARLPQALYDLELPLADLTVDLIREVEQLKPFGMGNPAPVFLSREVSLSEQRAVGQEGKHLKCTFLQNGTLRGGIAFSMGERCGRLPPALDVIFAPQINDFQGKQSPECLVKYLLSGRQAFLRDDDVEQTHLLHALHGALRQHVEGVRVTSDVPAVLPVKGTLVYCHSAQTAQGWRQKYPQLFVYQGEWPDARCYSAIVQGCALHTMDRHYERVILADGLLCPGELASLAADEKQVEVVALPVSSAVRRLAAGLCPTVEDLRQVYVTVRNGADVHALPMAGQRAQACIFILLELQLLSIDEAGRPSVVLPMRKCEPTASRLYRTLLEMKEGSDGTFSIPFVDA